MNVDAVQICLAGGKTALVSPADAWLSERRWGCHNRGYVMGHIKGRSVYLHRMVIGMIPKGGVVDHINGNPLDNRRENLRVVPKSLNSMNVGGRRRNNKTSQFLGVSRTRSGNFLASICVNGRVANLGTFGTEEGANVARLKKEKEVYGIQPRRALAFAAAGIE